MFLALVWIVCPLLCLALCDSGGNEMNELILKNNRCRCAAKYTSGYKWWQWQLEMFFYISHAWEGTRSPFRLKTSHRGPWPWVPVTLWATILCTCKLQAVVNIVTDKLLFLIITGSIIIHVWNKIVLLLWIQWKGWWGDHLPPWTEWVINISSYHRT